MKITAVVVTYNRINLLKRTVECLRANSPVNEIVVVNNGSTDGTSEWLDSQIDITVIHQDNVGGSGGFYTGIDYAYNSGADWIWCMDDDVFPRANCMERLLEHIEEPNIGILAPRRLIDGEIFCHDFTAYNLTNPFSSMYSGRIDNSSVNDSIYIAGTAFEGLFIRREVVEKIGLPTRDLFIFCDDTDYCIRTLQAGYKILYVPDALMDKQKFFSNDDWAERNRKKKWKRFYQTRNSAYLNHHYGKNWGVKYLRGFINVFGSIATAFFTAPFSKAWSFKDIPALWRAYCDGVNENLGKM